MSAGGPAVTVWYLCLEGGQSSRKRSGDLPVKAEACHLIIRDRLGQELKLGGTFRISAQGPFPRDKSRGGGHGCVGGRPREFSGDSIQRDPSDSSF